MAKKTAKKARSPAKEPEKVRKSRVNAWLEPDGLMRIAAWSRDGLSYAEVAKKCGVAVSTLKDWRMKYPAISAALTRGRADADIIVENALFKSAQGYTERMSKVFKVRRIEYDPQTGKKVREWEELIEHEEDTFVPGNVQAQTFWLKNRKPDVWKDKPVEEDEGSKEIRVLFESAVKELGE